MKAVGLFTILFLACGTAQSQSLRVLPVQIRGGQGFPAAIQFYCTEKYSRDDCKNDIFLLRQKLGRYSLEKLGSWSFVVASNGEWESILTQINLPIGTPAFSGLQGHMTVISQILFSGPVDRRAELMNLSGLPLDQLLNLAITHELGHVLCQERDERKATLYGERLRAGHAPACQPAEKRPNVRTTHEALLTTLSSAGSLTLEGQKNAAPPDSRPPSKAANASY